MPIRRSKDLLYACHGHFGMILLLLVVGTISLTQSEKPRSCPPVPDQQSSCVCQSDTGVIDLAQLVNNTLSPRFTNIADPDGSTLYSYNPCSGFTWSTCYDGYICQDITEKGKHAILNIANEGNGEKMFIDTGGRPYIHYEGFDNRVAVYLKCTKNKDPIVLSQGVKVASDSQQEFTFTLSSCQVCPGGCEFAPVDTPPSIIGVAGICVIILLLLAVVAYFVIGAMIMKFRCGETGIDVIPHKNFWKEFPFLIKDGCLFSSIPIMKLCDRTCKRNRDGYKAINCKK